MIVVTQTWLDSNIPDPAVELAARTPFRVERTTASGQSRGGGLALDVHTDWGTTSYPVGTFCSPDLEYPAVKCRPFKLVRELSSIVIVAVYILRELMLS